ncbi:putative membrane associated protein [Geobacillus sp. WSUCF1]|nr:putative membrane associated protein [Geobacillus sp. WSUCF1]
MRDVLFLPLTDGRELAIAADGSAAVGEKPGDAVYAPAETVAYFAARVALMELLSVGAEASAVILQNFVADDRWEALCRGIERACHELSLRLPVTGSTESNFSTVQSALGVMAVGTVAAERKRIGVTPEGAKFAVIGARSSARLCWRILNGSRRFRCLLSFSPLRLFMSSFRSVPKAFTTNGCSCWPPTAAKGGLAPARCRFLPLAARRRRF